MTSLDSFLESVSSQDTKRRLQTYSELVSFLSDPRSSLECAEHDLDQLIEGLANWVKSSNFRVSLNGLEVLCLMVDRMGENFKPHVTTVLPVVIDRLGDSKDQIRDVAQQLLLKLMMPGSTPQYVFDRLGPALQHKLWHVKEGILVTLQSTINRYGARCLQLSKILPDICRLLEDPSPQVREAAANSLLEIYRHVGEKVRCDLKNKGLSQQKLNHLYAKFDEVKVSGNMLPTAEIPPPRSLSSVGDEPDFDFLKPASGKPLQRKPSLTSGSGPRRAGATAAASANAGSGAVDEELFIKSFEDVPAAKIFSSRDVQEQMMKIKDVLSDPNITWEKRIDHLKQLRSLVIAGAADYDDFFQSLRMLESAFILVVKDLRSQVVREGCVTIAYLSQQLGTKFDHFAETVLPPLINLIPNSAKVMATSGIVCIRFIMQYVHTSRLIPIITSSLTSKSNIIRRYVLECINQILHSWPTHCLEKHIAILQDAIKKGMNDADLEARAFSRKAYWGFADHFKSQADALLNSLDASKQKMLQGEVSNSSSSSSLNGEHMKSKSRSRAASEERSAYTGAGHVNSSVRKLPQRISSSKSDAGDADMDSDLDLQAHKDVRIITPRQRLLSGSNSGSQYLNHNQYYNTIGHGTHRNSSGKGLKENSTSPAVMEGKLQRASSASEVNSGLTPKSRATLLSAARMSKGSSYSLPRKKTSSSSVNTAHDLLTPDRSSRTVRPRIGVSQSQPSSRSNSPSSARRVPVYSKNTPSKVDSGLGPRPSRIPGSHSQGTSREGSPARSFKGQAERRLSGGSSSKLASGGRTTPVLSQRLLRHGSDVEDALQDALVRSQQKRYDQYDSDDAASETSSVCSERSHGSYNGRSPEDLATVIAQLGSSSHLDRKEGLASLQHLLHSNRCLSRSQLRNILEIFTRMFHDPHSKVFTMFLDTLIELVYLQSMDMVDWVHILLPRLLTKAGGDMLGSVANKVQRALEVVRDCFPFDLQFNTLCKFIVDPSLGSNLKVRVSVLTYFHSLLLTMDPSHFVNSTEARLAVSKIINWTVEPRNIDARKASQFVLISLFNLNPAEFSLLLSELPKTFQDGATRILHSHIRSGSDETTDVLSPRNVTSPPGQNRSRPPSRSSLGYPDNQETENLNPEDIFDSIKKTSADIQSLSTNSKLEPCEDVKKKRDVKCPEIGTQDVSAENPDRSDLKCFLSGTSSDNQVSSLINRLGTGHYYSHRDVDLPPAEVGKIICDVLEELSSHRDRVEEKKNILSCLQNFIRKNCVRQHLQEEHFKSLLSLLLETLGDTNGDVKSLALNCLRWMLEQFPKRCESFAELLTLKVLEQHNQTYKEVQFSANDVKATIVQVLPPEQTFRILTSIIQTMEQHFACEATQMMTMVVERLPKELLEVSLPNLIPNLFKNYQHTDSHVRRASCICLVAIYCRTEDAMKPYLQTLNGHRLKLLNLYITKRKQQEANLS